jgi:hypothetical protein
VLPQILALGGIGEYLLCQEVKVPQKLVVYSRVYRSENLEEVLPGRFVEGPEEAGIIGVYAVEQYRQGIPLK